MDERFHTFNTLQMHAQVWIRPMELLMKYWMEHAIFEIVGAIGTPLVIDVVGYLYVDLIFAKTNIHERCWIRCFNMLV
jgi:hypothetical protein